MDKTNAPPPLPPPLALAAPAPAPAPRRRRRGSSSNLCSCTAAIAFLLLLAGTLTAVYFFVLRPRDPKIQVDSVKLPGFAARNGTVSFTFAQYAAVRNPNRASFTHSDSTLQLIYAGSQVGFMYIPAGEIAAGRTQFMAASFSVTSFPAGAGSMVVESRMRVTGRVKVLRYFTHHVEAVAGCQVGVSAGNGAVLGFGCRN